MAKFLIIAGILLVILGIFLLLVGRIPYLGKLPGDIHIERKGFNLYFPLTSCIILSLLISLIVIIIRFFK